MKKIIVKFLCIFIPLKKWRKDFRNYWLKNNLEALGFWVNRFTEIKSKKISFFEYADKIEELFLGGSQTAYGFIPKYFSNTAFNMSSNSQDSFTSFSLFNILKDKMPNLKTVFLRYGVFSGGFDVSKARTYKDLCSCFKYLFDIDYSPKNYKKKYVKISKQLDKLPLLPCKNGYIDLGNPNPNKDSTAKVRANYHLREHNREIKQDIWIEKLDELTKKCGGENVKLILVITPVTAEYRSYLPPSDVLFKDIYDLSKKLNIKIINFFEDEDFTAEDFYDSDHLNLNGAIKFTKKLKNIYYGEK